MQRDAGKAEEARKSKRAGFRGKRHRDAKDAQDPRNNPRTKRKREKNGSKDPPLRRPFWERKRVEGPGDNPRTKRKMRVFAAEGAGTQKTRKTRETIQEQREKEKKRKREKNGSKDPPLRVGGEAADEVGFGLAVGSAVGVEDVVEPDGRLIEDVGVLPGFPRIDGLRFS
jgi:hypothetical protein